MARAPASTSSTPTRTASSANKRTSKSASTAEKVKDRAASAAESAKRSAENAADRIGDKAVNAADTASRRAASLADDAIAQGRSIADEYVDHGVSRTEDIIRSVGRAIDAASQSLEDDGMRATAGYVRAASTGLHRAADEVDNFESGSVTGRVENFVRKQPMLTMGVLALAGFALAGALKRQGDR